MAGDFEHRSAGGDDVTIERGEGERVESVALGEKPRPGRMVEGRGIRLRLNERRPARIIDLERLQCQSDSHSVAARSRARLVTADVAGTESNAAESPRRIQKMKYTCVKLNASKVSIPIANERIEAASPRKSHSSPSPLDSRARRSSMPDRPDEQPDPQSKADVADVEQVVEPLVVEDRRVPVLGCRSP